ncbi:hypothetical protein PUN28_015817 [Cardiocondyla obscurior]|uniref:Uncharacterized protein n=1 Tax=Cardiocondyla obscurior TaxID=286306 RepID=A0AAW2EUA2_9HYME
MNTNPDIIHYIFDCTSVRRLHSAILAVNNYVQLGALITFAFWSAPSCVFNCTRAPIIKSLSVKSDFVASTRASHSRLRGATSNREVL